MTTIADLDPAEIGNALIRLAATSRLLGHTHIASTARDYLAPHGHDLKPEGRFVVDLIATGASPLVSNEVSGLLLDATTPET